MTSRTGPGLAVVDLIVARIWASRADFAIRVR
jgi:hypothetical protein